MVGKVQAIFGILLALVFATSQTAHSAEPSPSDIAVVVMHGKGGSPGKWVNDLALTLELEGFHVANLDMPWSHRRQYNATMDESANEITAALDKMRAKGAKKMFVAGHSQGGLNTLLYGEQHSVDGLIAIAPGGSHGAKSFREVLGSHVSKARSMIDEGRGNETAEFADQETAIRTFPVTTTAARYFDWFNPDNKHNMSHVVRNVKSGIPILYIAPTRDYPILKRDNPKHFSALPSHELTRLYEPETDHLNAPFASAEEIIKWIKEVAAK